MVIHTGGMLPDGSNAVVMVEHTEWIDDSAIDVMRPVAARDAVIRHGDDVAEGAVVIPQGARLRSQDLGGLAALGVTHVSVAPAPIVGLIATGDEIVPPQQTPKPGEVRDVNSTTLAVEVERAGGVARTSRHRARCRERRWRPPRVVRSRSATSSSSAPEAPSARAITRRT